MLAYKLTAAAIALTLTLGLASLVPIAIHCVRSVSTARLNGELLEALPEPPEADPAWDGVPYDSYDGLLWFVQLTDLHFSKFQERERVADLEAFCAWTRSAVDPALVIATGDLVDGKTVDYIGSTQYEAEWKTYGRTVRQHCNASTWIDIRGNHDTFDVPSDGDERNFFPKYGIMGENRRLFAHTVRKDGKTFSFVGIDATLTPAPKRPFNFFGAVSAPQMDELEAMTGRVEKDGGGFLAFGHYPLSVVTSPSPGIKALLGRSGLDAYVSGHLHTLMHLTPSLYTKHPEGFLELELADWKADRMFRMAAFDRGHLSFVDARFDSGGSKTSVLIVNPLDVRFVYGPKMKKALRSMLRSTHIRILVFSPFQVESIVADVDGGRETLECSNVKRGANAASVSPLFVARWFPEKYADGREHLLKLTVKLRGGNDGPIVVSRRFAVDEESLSSSGESFGLVQRLVLLSNVAAVLQAGLGASLAFAILPLCLLRLLHRLVLAGELQGPARPWRILRSLWIVANLDGIFYPVVLYLLYVAVGPWGIGYLTTDGLGVFFAWGVILGWSWVPAYMTFGYGYLTVVPYWYFLLLGAGWEASRRHGEAVEDGEAAAGCPSFGRYAWRNLWFGVLMLLQVLHAGEIMICYGLLASFSVCGFLRVVSFYVVWSRAVALRREDFARAGLIDIWMQKKEP